MAGRIFECTRLGDGRVGAVVRREVVRKRQSNHTVDKNDRDSVAGYRFRAAQAVGVRSASRWMEMSAKPGSTAAM